MSTGLLIFNLSICIIAAIGGVLNHNHNSTWERGALVICGMLILMYALLVLKAWRP